MRKPKDLTELIEELETENIQSDVRVTPESEAIIYLSYEDADKDDGIRLTPSDCKLLFSSKKVVQRLIEALPAPDEAQLILRNVELSTSALDACETEFISVDEE